MLDLQTFPRLPLQRMTTMNWMMTMCLEHLDVLDLFCWTLCDRRTRSNHEIEIINLLTYTLLLIDDWRIIKSFATHIRTSCFTSEICALTSDSTPIISLIHSTKMSLSIFLLFQLLALWMSSVSDIRDKWKQQQYRVIGGGGSNCGGACSTNSFSFSGFLSVMYFTLLLSIIPEHI